MAAAVPRLSIIIPAIDEAENLGTTLPALARLRRAGHEIVVVDGGSRDDTCRRARSLADRVLVAGRGRARQMNAGAAAANGDVLLFLHADSLLPGDAEAAIARALRVSCWGRFDVRLWGREWSFRMIEAFMNLRSRVTGIATGDQAIFVERAAFEQVGGYPDIPLMEDVAISRLLKSIARPACLRQRVITSARRWRANGIVRTVILMWSLRLAYALGADPQRLARRYERG
ncbi:MAG: TIGR04283 family arsenosugar biosynthesis glycosyltransferase [Gammaproteobacteria bacterium]|nr:MAG: TIGR04283 family arsenosugar biosynthesis glycosyltransferase [Gammaproteobacteria bacterium]